MLIDSRPPSQFQFASDRKRSSALSEKREFRTNRREIFGKIDTKAVVVAAALRHNYPGNRELTWGRPLKVQGCHLVISPTTNILQPFFSTSLIQSPFQSRKLTSKSLGV
jgi:hypothetical protein